jgi:hypothetical protein
MDQHYLGILIIRDFYKLIQNTLPSFNVFSSMYLLSSIISLYYAVYTLQKLSYNKISFAFLFFISSITMIFFLENIISITHTRFATVFCGVALINKLFRKLNNKSYLIHFSIFLFGMLTRPESGMGMVLVVGLGYLIHKFEPLKLIKKTFLPVLSILVLIATFYVHRHFTDRFEIKIEPDIEYAFSTDRVLPIDSMKTAEDSLKHEMGLSGMFIDTAFVSASFLKGLVVNQFEIRYHQIFKSTEDIIFLYGYYNLFFIVFILMLILVALHNDYKGLLKLLAFFVFMFLLLIYLDYNIRVEDRHFASMQIIAFIVYLIYAIHSYSFRKSLNSKIAVIFIPLIIFSSFSTLKNALGNQVQVAKDVECLESVLYDIEQIYQDRIIVATLYTYHLFDRKFSSPFREDKNPSCTFTFIDNKLYLKDWGTSNGVKDCFDVVKELYKIPAQNQHVISISATGPTGWVFGNNNFSQPSYYTDYGKSLVSYAAPGGSVGLAIVEGNFSPCTLVGTFRTATNTCAVFDQVFSTVRGATNGNYNWAQGTSMASPAAAGVVALMMQANGGHLSPAQVFGRLRQSSTDLGKPGNDEYYGHGFVNAAKAVGLNP